ncbi:hypothetical protein H8958_019487 [Nasalis larvatus]|uniref:putative uncharacterized protein FLJ39060 n=1 Tax=Rhinopithecus roxellana TaxID=61622 RepID=UPI0012379B94|nr:putative uncharacterized protein FLJ39060 [Rhinopithecus roxellana]XP_030790624.1 putative uncharacterized protein FLJ39060 [Rhinopithecus roxellana]XP_033057811.1 putative uncharacterized protein FLJ39060 [Trachypithecus francoisi]
MVDGRTETIINDIFFTEPTPEMSSLPVHSHSSLSLNLISLMVICRGIIKLVIHFRMYCPPRLKAKHIGPTLRPVPLKELRISHWPNECIRHSASVPMATGANGLETKDETKTNAEKCACSVFL